MANTFFRLKFKIEDYETNDLWDQVQVINQVDENGQPMWSTSHNNMKAYIVGVGNKHNYLAGSTRTSYSTFVDRILEMRAAVLAEADKQDDKLVHLYLVYAHEIYHVRKLYPGCLTSY